MSYKKIKLGEALIYEQPTKYIVSSDKYSDEFQTPVLTAGKSFILGYTNEKEGIYTGNPVIIFDDFTTATKFVDFPFKVKSSAMKILKANSKIADIRYMYFLMQTLKFDHQQHKRYWISKYSQIQIPLPPLSEQKRIAAILDKADALRKRTREILQQYDLLSQSIFLEMFGEYLGKDLIPLKNLMTFSQGKQVPIEKQSLVVKDGFARFLRIVDFTQGEDLRYVPNNDIKYYVNKDDIVIVRYGASAGFVGTNKEGVLANNLFKLNFDRDKFNSVFLFYAFNHRSFKGFIKKEAFGAAMPALSFKVMERFKIPVPPIERQNKFATIIQNIEKQKELAKQSLKGSEDLFQALLQKAFKGELT